MNTAYIIPALMLVATVAMVINRFNAVKAEADANLRAHYDAQPEKAEARALMREAGYNV
ncbi:hypothetical protein [Burkholderia ubonensis]|uniref:hypothetical protein n=1 Tax=Burkholderia ubonensis TaxID=101571 RepID=UPI000B14548F|nr:hypothetical protein [Burkholderia ubonensis]